MFKVEMTKKALKSASKMPEKEQELMALLLDDLKKAGPVQGSWPNYSKLSKKNTHHCHLSHRWVACWTYEKQTVTIEVYYAGSRRNAPY